MTYGEKYFKKLYKNLDKKNISSETLYMLSKINIKELADSDESLANTDLDTIYLPSMKKIMNLLQKSSEDIIKDVELLIVKQQEIMDSIVDHEVGHTLEYVYKKIGMTIYNNNLLPKLLDGSLGIKDEESFENNKDKLREFMKDTFIKIYTPNNNDILEFEKFIKEYYIPDGPFGLIDKISSIDNYIIDIYIENDIINLVPEKSKMDNKFINMRSILYDNNDSYSIYRCLQIYIDPRFNNKDKFINTINNNIKFNNFLNINITNLNLSNDLFTKTNPNFNNITIKDLLLEIKEVISEVRNYGFDGNYLAFKDNNNVNSGNISLLTSKLAKVVYIKQLEFEGDKEKEIKDIMNNDSSFGSFSNSSSSNNESEQNEIFEDLNSQSFEDALKKIGHDGDFADELTNFMDESLNDINNYLNNNIISSKFNNINNEDINLIPSIINKDVSYDYYKTDENLSNKREELLLEIKNHEKYKYLLELVEEFKSMVGEYTYLNNSAGETHTLVDDYMNGNEFMYTLTGNASLDIYLHCFIDDSISMKQSYDNKYSIMDYQIVNTLLLIELFKDIEGVEILVSNYSKKEFAMNILYDSSKDNNIDLSSISTSKLASPLYQYIVESNLKMKSLNPNKDIVNIFMSDGDDTMNPKNFKISEDFFKEIVKDSYFLQLKNEKIPNISDIFSDRYLIIKENPIENIIGLIENMIERFEKNISFSDNDKKNIDF